MNDSTFWRAIVPIWLRVFSRTPVIFKETDFPPGLFLPIAKKVIMQSVCKEGNKPKWLTDYYMTT